MHTPLRAGLLAVILFLVVVCASAAPLATTRTRVDAGFHSPLGHGHPSSNLGQTRVSSVIRIEKEPTFSLHDAHGSSRHAQIHLESTNEGVSPILEREVLTRRSKISEHFKRLGEKIREHFKAFGAKVKAGFQKFAAKAKAGFQKVGHFFKETGAKIAKFGLKVIATVTKVVSKVVGFIPGIGKIAGKAMELVSKGINIASDKIHATLGGKLGKAMAGMNKTNKVVGYIP